LYNYVRSLVMDSSVGYYRLVIVYFIVHILCTVLDGQYWLFSDDGCNHSELVHGVERLYVEWFLIYVDIFPQKSLVVFGSFKICFLQLLVLVT